MSKKFKFLNFMYKELGTLAYLLFFFSLEMLLNDLFLTLVM